MIDNKKPLKNFPRLYTIHSQKGGVGKTSLALGIASLAAIIEGKKTLIVDADMTGTSLDDVDSSERELSTQSDKRLLLNPNNDKRYFNDLIFAIPPDFDQYTQLFGVNAKEKAKISLEPFVWELRDSEGNIFVMPGDSSPKAVQAAVPFLSQESQVHFFRHRLEKIIAAAFLADFQVVILDNSPGLYGISKSSFAIVLDQLCEPNNSRLYKLTSHKHTDCKRSGFRIQALLVSTVDTVDFCALLPACLFCIERHNTDDDILKSLISSQNVFLDTVFNKFPEEKYSAKDPAFIISGLIDRGLNQKNDLENKEERGNLSNYFKERLKAYGTYTGPYIEGFELKYIVSTTKHMKSNEIPVWARSIGQWEKWLRFVGNIAELRLSPSLS